MRVIISTDFVLNNSSIDMQFTYQKIHPFEVYMLVVYSQSVQPLPQYLISEYFHHSKKKPHIHLQALPMLFNH